MEVFTSKQNQSMCLLRVFRDQDGLNQQTDKGVWLLYISDQASWTTE